MSGPIRVWAGRTSVALTPDTPGDGNINNVIINLLMEKCSEDLDPDCISTLPLEIVYSSFQERPLLWNQAQAFDTQGSLEKKKERADEDTVRFPRELFVLVFVKVEQA